MRFFTLDWWGKGAEADPFPAYAAHVAALRSRLPPDLVALAERVSLHDAQLREFALDSSAGTLWLGLEGEEQGRPCKIRLQYSGVSRLRSLADPARGLPGPHGYGDLGYDELDVAGDELIHRILFSSGIELDIRFRGFRLELEPPRP